MESSISDSADEISFTPTEVDERECKMFLKRLQSGALTFTLTSSEKKMIVIALHNALKKPR